MPFAPILQDAAAAASAFGGPQSRLEALALPFTDARLEEAYRYWQRKAATRAMPCRADIDPTEIPKLLPDVMLVDVLPGGRYRYRLRRTDGSFRIAAKRAELDMTDLRNVADVAIIL